MLIIQVPLLLAWEVLQLQQTLQQHYRKPLQRQRILQRQPTLQRPPTLQRQRIPQPPPTLQQQRILQRPPTLQQQYRQPPQRQLTPQQQYRRRLLGPLQARQVLQVLRVMEQLFCNLSQTEIK